MWYYQTTRKTKLWQHGLYLIAAVALLGLIIMPPKAVDRITFLDVGQGSGAVIETTERDCVLFDCGRSKDTVASYLRYRGINHIDAIVLSHADMDHIGGLNNIMRDFTVDMVIADENAWQDEALQALEEDGVFSETKIVAAAAEDMAFGKLKVSL